MLPKWIIPWLVTTTTTTKEEQASTKGSGRNSFNLRSLLDIGYAVLVLYLSKPVISNLFLLDGQKYQLMNAAFDPYSLVNTYGAFGSVGKQRFEPIVYISYNENVTSLDEIEWIELEFPCKPGSIYRRPCFCEPYHCKCVKCFCSVSLSMLLFSGSYTHTHMQPPHRSFGLEYMVYWIQTTFSIFKSS